MARKTCYLCRWFGRSSDLDTKIGQASVPACLKSDIPKETNALAPICDLADFEAVPHTLSSTVLL